MCIRKFFCLLFSLSLSLLIWFSVESPVKVSALSLPSGGRFLTAQETLQFIGSEIPVTYFDGTNYQQTVASYDSSFSWTVTENSTDPVGFMSGQQTVWLDYTLPKGTYTNNASYTTFDLQPTYSLFDTQFVFTCFGMSYATNPPSYTTYNSPQSDWYIGGTVHHFENTSESSSGSGYKAYLSGGTHRAIFVPISFSSQSTFSAYAMSATFFGNGGNSVSRHFYVMCPYISNDASGASGTFDTSGGQTGGTTGTGDINVNVDVDMTETNGLLGRIEIILSGIVDGIKGLFVPDDEFLSDWVDDMKDLLEDHLGGLYQAVSLLDTFWDQFEQVTAKQVIDIPACSVPLAGSTFTLGPYSVPLKVSGLPVVLYDGIAYIIDFLAVMAFIKMCRNKLDIFLNPDSEVVQSDN